jgi:hypothetical protein
MRFVALYSAGEPDIADEGDWLWSGGDGDGEDRLSASLITAIWPELEVGDWIKLRTFTAIISKPQSSPVSLGWSSVQVLQAGTDGTVECKIEIDQVQAILEMCKKIAEFLKNYGNDDSIWIRFL